jgi:hypothetical protein
MVRDALWELGIMEDLQQSKNVISSLQACMFHPAKREDQDWRKKQVDEIKAMLFRSPQLDSVRDALQHIQSDVDGGWCWTARFGINCLRLGGNVDKNGEAE